MTSLSSSPEAWARIMLVSVLTQFFVGGRASCAEALRSDAAPQRPNVLFIIIDDHGADLHDVFQSSQVHTPNMQSLAARSAWFTRAYVDVPACGPSRTAFLTGMHAARSGVYYNEQAYRRTRAPIGRAVSLPGQFLGNGYLTAGYGKIAHNRYLEDDIGDYTPGFYKMLNRLGDVTYTDKALLRQVIFGTLTKAWVDNWSWGILPDDWDLNDPAKLQQDTEQANRVIKLLGEKHDKPFFAALGFWKPHVSWTVAQRYFDMYPLESIQLPAGCLEGDLDDVPKPARWLATHRGEHAFILRNNLWKKCLQAYFASISYVDEQVGRVLGALEASRYRENTIVVLISDNGWHNGEKEHWSKFYLSELGCRVVFSVHVPGLPPQICDTPVSTIDLYPTLMDLCGLPAPETHSLDGINLSPILRQTRSNRGRPVLSTYGPGCHSIRDERFRYTRYRNGDEELYDHTADPHEWRNLAADPRFAPEKRRLVRWLPERDAPEIEYAVKVGSTDVSNVWSEEAFK
ncbi:MAG: sulfatase [Opitutaceae bacterium]|nr:sulfatase [Opitutaceae bacterium]